VESVPDALASGVLAGVNPLYALYAVMLATPVGAFFASSVFLSVQTTSAMSLVVAGVAGLSSNPEMLFTLTLFTGVLMLLAGFLRLGRLMRFVSISVMVGFMNGIAVLIMAEPDTDQPESEGVAGEPEGSADEPEGSAGGEKRGGPTPG
jgi:SulP family sulfate permease